MRERASISYETLASAEPGPSRPHLLPPIDLQEVWAAGVTYLRSKTARMEESRGAAVFYDMVYDAERPELFFKATPHRVVGPNGVVQIRWDSTWNVPEPEIGLVLSPAMRIVGYTIGNDMSSRDIEGANPLYLPQAKVYERSCALGPVLLLEQDGSDHRVFDIRMRITRGGSEVFAGDASSSRMKRRFRELAGWLGRENAFPHGAVLLTGTGIVPEDDFTLRSGDYVEIDVPDIGTLGNTVRQNASPV
jgi:2-dehydro-3-deoxy-D-arabinonate dehydratase